MTFEDYPDRQGVVADMAERSSLTQFLRKFGEQLPLSSKKSKSRVTGYKKLTHTAKKKAKRKKKASSKKKKIGS